MQLIKKIFISGEITAVTGLHIGSTNIGLSIGGTDNPVVRNPVSGEPYIPGSSLKGKMRCLIERMDGKLGERMSNDVRHGPFTDDVNHRVCKVFGVPAEAARDENVPPSRLIVRDCNLQNGQMLLEAKGTDMPYTEVKTEVVIDRVTSAAMPRQIERVPAGAKFSLNLVLNVFEGDDEPELLNTVWEGLKLVQDDYLGGQGTRGSGQVKIEVEKLEEKTETHYKEDEGPTARSDQIPAELACGKAVDAASGE